jgi:hypothetical protein
MLNRECQKYKIIDKFTIPAFQVPLPQAVGVARSAHAPLCQFYCEFIGMEIAQC